jgi:hypothetical protein
MGMELRITVDDRTLRNASEITGLKDPGAVIAHVLDRFVREDAIRHLIDRAGKHPDTEAPPRRRPPEFRTDLQS